jgi:hypothetical protein
MKVSEQELTLMRRESGLRVGANNPSSTALGVGQLLISNRKKFAADCGADPAQELEDSGTMDPYKQVCMMRLYVKASRHKTFAAALSYWDQHKLTHGEGSY